uniref:Heparan-sulfate 6-O-sulfotransferase n=1 Tax=Pelusios castaneus TaxID=367368 RepID=A0A8C8VHV6_9SAUR
PLFLVHNKFPHKPNGRAALEELDLFPTPDPHYVKKYYFPVRALERALAFDMKGEDVIVFLHIQKTGGTTFGRHLVQNVRLEVPCDCRPGQKKCTCYRPNRRETWLFSRFSTGWSCGLHADWTELTSCVPGVLDKRESSIPLCPPSFPCDVSRTLTPHLWSGHLLGTHPFGKLSPPPLVCIMCSTWASPSVPFAAFIAPPTLAPPYSLCGMHWTFLLRSQPVHPPTESTIPPQALPTWALPIVPSTSSYHALQPPHPLCTSHGIHCTP